MLKADVNTTTRDDYSALQLAVSRNHNSIVELITEQMDLDVNHHSNGGSALHMAAKNGNIIAVQLILNHSSLNRKYIIPYIQQLHQPRSF
jgi:ankyrin repeat protein